MTTRRRLILVWIASAAVGLVVGSIYAASGYPNETQAMMAYGTAYASLLVGLMVWVL